MKSNINYFAFVQKYTLTQKLITNYVNIPPLLHSKANELFPLLQLSDEYLLLPVESIRHMCVNIPFDGACCLTEIRIDYEHD